MHKMNRGRGGRRSFDNNRRVDNRFKKPDYGSPSQSKPSNFNQNKSTTNSKVSTNTPTKEIPKKEEVKQATEVKRERSRSPIDKKIDNAVKSEGSESRQENVNTYVKYTGRPGEKKFSARCRLFIANLPTNMSEADVTGLFEPFGETKEVYFNKDKGFGFIRLDYRINAESAKSNLDKKVHKGRTIQVRFATHASAIELHGLDQYASNEIIEKAMSQFGVVEKAVIVCDDRGKSKGYAIVEFEWKKSAQKVLEKLKGELFVLGRLPKPVFAKPLTQNDEEDGISEASLERLNGFKEERECSPRFISPNSFEFPLAQKWKDLYLEEQEKKERLERELEEARYKVQFEMEAISREQDAMRIREELARRQEELRQIEEDMQQKRQMVYGGGRPPNMNNSNNFDNRGPPPRGAMGPPGSGPNFRPNMQQRPDQGPGNMNSGGSVLGPSPNMPQNGPGLLQQNPSMQPGMIPRLPPPPGIPGMRPLMMQGGPGGPRRDMPPRGGEHRFRPRRN